MKIKKCKKVDECYSLIALVDIENTSIEQLLLHAKKTIEGLKDLEFYVALELDNEEKSSLEVELLTRLIGY